MPTEPSDRQVLQTAARRFLWMTLVIYAGLTIGLWLAHAIAPTAISAVTDYTVSVSLIGAVSFGGLYAAALALRPSRSRPSPAADRP